MLRYLSLLRPNVESFGFGLCLSISVTSVWGGMFPYLETALRTNELTALFYTVQLVSMCIMFLAIILSSRKRPMRIEKSFAIVCSVPYAAGPLLLIAALYVEALTMPLVFAAAVLLGAACAATLTGWECVFASRDSMQGKLFIATGAGYSAVIYFLLCLIPPALTAYVIPLVLVPLEGLCLWIAAQEPDNDQPMFQDVPNEHKLVYRNALRENVVPAIMVGTLGFSAGAIRFIAITHQSILSEINILSMAALLVVVLAFLGFWQVRNIRIDLLDVYRVLFPLAATSLLLLPFAGQAFTNAASALCYACFTMASMLVIMHCCQVSRDSGINPPFMFCFYFLVMYVPQLAGYLIGYLSGIANSVMPNVEQLSLVALVSLYLLLLSGLMGRSRTKLHTGRLEFLMLFPEAYADASGEIALAKTIERSVDAGADGRDGPLDLTSTRCQAIAEAYGLSAREGEVMELVVRGGTGPSIAEKLFISEATVRTHTRRIYQKLGIHKKQELISLANESAPSLHL